jgi:hypothetical protein
LKVLNNAKTGLSVGPLPVCPLCSFAGQFFGQLIISPLVIDFTGKLATGQPANQLILKV